LKFIEEDVIKGKVISHAELSVPGPLPFFRLYNYRRNWTDNNSGVEREGRRKEGN
jgi:hypothetical protein